MLNREEYNIVKIDVLKVNYARKKICNCKKPSYEIDYRNRLVYCTKCTAIIEPFEVLYDLAKRYEETNNSLERLWEQKQELIRYKPYLRAIKRIESNVRSGKMLPICPRCNQLFRLEDVNSYGNKLLYKEE